MSKLVRNGWLTNQHGAWPMAFVPVLVGSILGGFSWSQLLLGFSWLSAFLFFDVLGRYIKIIRPRRGRTPNSKAHSINWQRGRRFQAPLITYAGVATLGAVWLIFLHPRLLFWGAALAPLATLAISEMWMGRDRSFLARACAIAASMLLLPIAFQLGSTPDNWADAWTSTAIVTAYFIGTVPHVKALIRERGNRRWRSASTGYHAFLLLAATVASFMGWTSWWVTVLAALLLLRAWAYPSISESRDRPLPPLIIGITEFAMTALVFLVSAF